MTTAIDHAAEVERHAREVQRLIPAIVQAGHEIERHKEGDVRYLERHARMHHAEGRNAQEREDTATQWLHGSDAWEEAIGSVQAAQIHKAELEGQLEFEKAMLKLHMALLQKEGAE